MRCRDHRRPRTGCDQNALARARTGDDAQVESAPRRSGNRWTLRLEDDDARRSRRRLARAREQATRDTRRPGRLPRSAHPPSRSCDAQRTASPRASRGVGPAKPALTRASALFAGGARSNSSKPKLRSDAHARPRIAEQLDQAIGEPDDAGAILRAPAGEALEQLRRCPDRRGDAGQQLGKHRRIAQSQVESLARHRMQRLRRVADQHRARGDRCRGRA